VKRQPSNHTWREYIEWKAAHCEDGVPPGEFCEDCGEIVSGLHFGSYPLDYEYEKELDQDYGLDGW
jgi:hypothetical protein